MKKILFTIIFILIFSFSLTANAATYTNGVLNQSTLSTQQSNKTNAKIRNDILNYNSIMDEQNKQSEQTKKNKKYNSFTDDKDDKYLDKNPNWWRWENTNQGYTYFY